MALRFKDAVRDYAKAVYGKLRAAMSAVGNRQANPARAPYEIFSYEGNGKISVKVKDIVSSPQFQRQLAGVREIQRASETQRK